MPAYRNNPRSAALEVTTTAAPHAPSIAFTSATPLAFTFPAAPSPFDSPASLEFPVVHHHQHQHLKPTLRLQTPPHARSPSPMSPASPASDTSPVFSSPASSIGGRSPARSPVRGDAERSRSRSPARPPAAKRRRSAATAFDDSMPRPKKGDAEYVKRPENAFILFRRKCVEERLQEQEAAEAAAKANATSPKPKRTRQADLSKMISAQWRSLSTAERTHWEDMAKEKKKEHERLHPGYVYRPQRKEPKKATPASLVGKKGKARAETDDAPNGQVEFTIPLNRHARSSSADSGFTSQTIRLPIVNMDMPNASYAWGHPHPGSSMMSPSYPPHYQPMPTFMPVGWSGAPVPTYGGVGQMVSPTDTTSPTSPFAGPFTPVTPWGASYNEPSIAGADMPFVSDSPCRSPGRGSFEYTLPTEPTDLFSPVPPTPAPAPAPTPFDQLPARCDMPWTFEFSGEFVPSGADFLLDADFDLSQIPEVTLDELREIDGGSHPLSGWQDLSHIDLSGAAAPPAATIVAGMASSPAPAADAPTSTATTTSGQDPFMYYDSILSAGRF